MASANHCLAQASHRLQPLRFCPPCYTGRDMIPLICRFLRGLFRSRSGMPWHVWLGLVARNNAIKLRHWQLCCGNAGQPGC